MNLCPVSHDRRATTGLYGILALTALSREGYEPHGGFSDTIESHYRFTYRAAISPRNHDPDGGKFRAYNEVRKALRSSISEAEE
jgi:hypothetical protein